MTGITGLLNWLSAGAGLMTHCITGLLNWLPAGAGLDD